MNKEIVYAIIEDGEIVNVIVADQEFVDQYHPGKAILISDMERQPGIGWKYRDEKFIEPEPQIQDSDEGQ